MAELETVQAEADAKIAEAKAKDSGNQAEIDIARSNAKDKTDLVRIAEAKYKYRSDIVMAIEKSKADAIKTMEDRKAKVGVARQERKANESKDAATIITTATVENTKVVETKEAGKTARS
ncbi:hypothetical protein Q7M84_00230 [Candidatus Liberibacter asiaticus]